jgi:hypothetical protein
MAATVAMVVREIVVEIAVALRLAVVATAVVITVVIVIVAVAAPALPSALRPVLQLLAAVAKLPRLLAAAVPMLLPLKARRTARKLPLLRPPVPRRPTSELRSLSVTLASAAK